MIKSRQIMCALAMTATSFFASSNGVVGLDTALHNTGAVLHGKQETSKSHAESAYGATSVVHSLSAIVHPAESSLRSEIEGFTGLPAGSDNIKVIDYRMRQSGMTVNNYAVVDVNTQPQSGAAEALGKGGSKLVVTDFSDSEKAAGVINGLVEKDTQGTIPTLVQSEDISRDTLLVLLNTLFVQKDWATQFDPRSFLFSGFDSSGQQCLKVVKGFGGMKNIVSLDRSGYTVFKLSATDEARVGRFDFVVKYPDEGVGVAPVSSEDLTDLANYGRSELTRFSMPNGKVESTHNLASGLSDRLPTLLAGISFSTTAFDCPVAVSTFRQKASVEWNEKGFKAAAATAMMVFKSCASFESPKKVIEVERPFTFMIVYTDQNTTIPVFSGQLASFDAMTVVRDADEYDLEWLAEKRQKK